MNLKQLAKRVAAEIQPGEDGELYLLFDRNWKRDATRGLRRTTLEELETLHGRLSRAIPDDFDFWLTFDGGKARAELVYEDGMQAGAGMPFPVALDAALLANLRKLNWDRLRFEAIEGSQMHERIGDVAENLPSRVEPTAQIHDDFREVIEDYLQHVAREKIDLVFLAVDEEAEKFSEVIVSDDTYLVHGIGDCMTLGMTIVAVVANGTLLGPEETDALKQRALEGLAPISRAKAEGRFGEALRMMVGG